MGIGFNIAGITEGISRALDGFLSTSFAMPGLPNTDVPIWPIGIIIAAVFIVMGQMRRKD